MLRGLLLWLLCTGLASADMAVSQKTLIGAVETIEVVESGFAYQARVDTGAASCSIHADDIRAPDGEDPIGQVIGFTLRDADGRTRRMSLPVEATAIVKTAEGRERRYKVFLTLKWRDHAKRVLVNLNDRSALTYPLLLGRNWLSGDFIVDVERNSGE